MHSNITITESSPGDIVGTILLQVTHELDRDHAFKLATLTAVEHVALIEQLRGPIIEMRRARLKLARAAKVRPTRMLIVCSIVEQAIVFSILAPPGPGSRQVRERLLPVAREVIDEWFARDERLRANSTQESTAVTDASELPVETPPASQTHHEKLAASPHCDESVGLASPTEQPAHGTASPAKGSGTIRVTYSAGEDPPRYPPADLPPAQPSKVASFKLGETREIVCEIVRRTASDRCLLKEVGSTRQKEATFSTSGALPTLLNLLCGCPSVRLRVNDYLSGQLEQRQVVFHIAGLAGVTEDWIQEPSVVVHLQSCLDHVTELLKDFLRLKSEAPQ